MTTTFISLFFLLTTLSDNLNASLFKEEINSVEKISSKLQTGWYYVVDSPNGEERRLDKSSETYFISPTPIITALNIIKCDIYEASMDDQSYIGMKMQLDKVGTNNWSIATNKSIGKQLAFILNDQLIQVSKVNSRITTGMTAIHRGDYSRSELETFIKTIETEKKNSQRE